MTQNPHTDYTAANHPLQDQYTPAGQEGQARPVIMRKRIGSTVYRVNVHFSDTSKDTIGDKIDRLIRREAVGE
ncbi:transposon-encoded TnpW family protein [Christensenellaceae bacterium OttesenSCG-928-L17]|nr:transposon-encoded TnpW family protein [Christensenellaceae bacterium OttesenSCG-928-L17]